MQNRDYHKNVKYENLGKPDTYLELSERFMLKNVIEKKITGDKMEDPGWGEGRIPKAYTEILVRGIRGAAPGNEVSRRV